MRLRGSRLRQLAEPTSLEEELRHHWGRTERGGTRRRGHHTYRIFREDNTTTGSSRVGEVGTGSATLLAWRAIRSFFPFRLCARLAPRRAGNLPPGAPRCHSTSESRHSSEWAVTGAAGGWQPRVRKKTWHLGNPTAPDPPHANYCLYYWSKSIHSGAAFFLRS